MEERITNPRSFAYDVAPILLGNIAFVNPAVFVGTLAPGGIAYFGAQKTKEEIDKPRRYLYYFAQPGPSAEAEIKARFKGLFIAKPAHLIARATGIYGRYSTTIGGDTYSYSEFAPTHFLRTSISNALLKLAGPRQDTIKFKILSAAAGDIADFERKKGRLKRRRSGPIAVLLGLIIVSILAALAAILEKIGLKTLANSVRLLRQTLIPTLKGGLYGGIIGYTLSGGNPIAMWAGAIGGGGFNFLRAVGTWEKTISFNRYVALREAGFMGATPPNAMERLGARASWPSRAFFDVRNRPLFRTAAFRAFPLGGIALGSVLYSLGAPAWVIPAMAGAQWAWDLKGWGMDRLVSWRTGGKFTTFANWAKANPYRANLIKSWRGAGAGGLIGAAVAPFLGIPWWAGLALGTGVGIASEWVVRSAAIKAGQTAAAAAGTKVGGKLLGFGKYTGKGVGALTAFQLARDISKAIESDLEYELRTGKIKHPAPWQSSEARPTWQLKTELYFVRGMRYFLSGILWPFEQFLKLPVIKEIAAAVTSLVGEGLKAGYYFAYKIGAPILGNTIGRLPFGIGSFLKRTAGEFFKGVNTVVKGGIESIKNVATMVLGLVGGIISLLTGGDVAEAALIAGIGILMAASTTFLNPGLLPFLTFGPGGQIILPNENPLAKLDKTFLDPDGVNDNKISNVLVERDGENLVFNITIQSKSSTVTVTNISDSAVFTLSDGSQKELLPKIQDPAKCIDRLPKDYPPNTSCTFQEVIFAEPTFTDSILSNKIFVDFSVELVCNIDVLAFRSLGFAASDALIKLYCDVEQFAGTPAAMIAAIASIEGKQVFDYNDSEITRFSADSGGSGIAGQGIDPKNSTPNFCGAIGPMQFLIDHDLNYPPVAPGCGGATEVNTWNSYKNIVLDAGASTASNPDARNIKNANYGAGKKMMNDCGRISGTDCAGSKSWSETQVRAAAEGYLGSCVSGGFRYCDIAWAFYSAVRAF